jgi:hypothetical protein
MASGGQRFGAGRPKGAKGRRTKSVEERIAALGVDPIDALVAIGMEARDSGDLTLAAGVFKELARYVYPQRKAVDPVAAQQPSVIQVITGVSRCPDDPLQDAV